MMKTEIPIQGGCACKKIRYQCTQLPYFMFQCHCRDCQRAIGGPFAANVWFKNESVVFDLEPKSYIVTSDIGDKVHHQFCPDCGSPIGMKIEERPEIRGVRASTLDDPTWLVPDANIFMKNAYPWEVLDPERPSFEVMPPLVFMEKLRLRNPT